MDFVLSIKDLPEGSCKREYAGRLAENLLNCDEMEISGEISVKAEITRSRDQLIFKGKFTAPVKLVCARCTEEFEKLIESELVFVLTMIAGQAEEVLEDDSSEDYYFIPEGSLDYDFSEHIRERLILALEMKPLCRQNCKGICSRCGINLNLEKCDCVSEKIDERWLPLKDLTDRS